MTASSTKNVLDSLVDIFAICANDDGSKWTPSMFKNQAAAWQLSYAGMVGKEDKSAEKALNALLATIPRHDEEKTDDALVQIFLVLCEGKLPESNLWRTWLNEGRTFAGKMLKKEEQPSTDTRPPTKPLPKKVVKKSEPENDDAASDARINDHFGAGGWRRRLSTVVGGAPNEEKEVAA